MGWQRRLFKKDSKVWVFCDESGEPVVDNGRVSMRYSMDEGSKVYRASPKNVAADPGAPADEANAAEAPAESPAQPRQQSLPTAAAGTNGGGFQIHNHEAAHTSTELPDELAKVPPPDPGIIEVYTDGACSGNPGPCGYGLLMRDGNAYLEKSEYLGQGTNNIAELTAIKVALESVADRSRPVRIYTDSSYAIGVLTKGWKAKANRELILAIRELLEGFDDVKIYKVRGHAGHPLNERADDLATGSIPG